ncbi:MAG: hypothetical protein IPM24_09160 [Bryobacterales bacterium]|nr:hypothetical protein [Bryobacterales bacterium]
MRLLPVKSTLVILTLAGCLVLPERVPALKQYGLIDWHVLPGLLDFPPGNLWTVAEEIEEPRVAGAAVGSTGRIAGAEGALDTFFAALHRTEMGEQDAVTRVLHYGDSPTTADMITADVRDLLQSRFGDAGHGFCLITKPWAWYGHRGLRYAAEDWVVEAATQTRVRDGFYGLGGASFRGETGVTASFTLKEPGQTRFELSFLRQPSGGIVSIDADGRPVGAVNTASLPGSAASPDWREFALPAAARRVRLTVASGSVRLFGVRFEKPGPGVVYDSLGLNGAYISVLARMFHERHWAEQLRHARPHLIVINYGTNESAYEQFIEKSYAKELREAVRRIREATPATSVLVMSPMDRGVRELGGDIGTLPAIPRLVAIQEEVAREEGCAFFNTFLAMGGEGTMGRWYDGDPRLVGGDFIHPMPRGARIIGNLLYEALFDSYNRYKIRRMQERMAATREAR